MLPIVYCFRPRASESVKMINVKIKLKYPGTHLKHIINYHKKITIPSGHYLLISKKDAWYQIIDLKKNHLTQISMKIKNNT